MCGVFYLSSLDEKLNLKDASLDVSKRLNHRGPDFEGIKYFENSFLFQNVLAIISTQNLNYPVSDSSRRFFLSYNGEIYNYQMLRKDLRGKNINFETDTDTEVLLKGIICEGQQFISKLEGMFAFVFVDSHTNEVLFARDTLGIKPLYLYQDEKNIALSSQVKAFKSFANLGIDTDKFSEYLLFGFVSGENTLVKKVTKVKPGHFGLLKNGRIKIQAYQTVKNYKNEDIKTELEQTIVNHCYSKRGLGLFLSGGLDSSFIAAVLSRNNIPFKSFGLGIDDPENDESSYQNYVASKFSFAHNTYMMGGDDLLSSIENNTKKFDFPLYHISSFLLYDLYSKAQSQTRTILTGEGGDELFSGYARYNLKTSDFSKIMSSKKYQESKGPLQNFYPLLRRLYTSPEKIKKLYPRLQLNKFPNRLAYFEQILNKNTSVPKVLREYDQNIHLESLLYRHDEISMQNSMECRVPFCTVSLFRQMNDIYNDGKDTAPKFYLKEMLKNDFPAEFINRKKKGLGLPLHRWLTTTKLSALLDVLHSQKFKERGLFSYPDISFEIEKLKAGDTTSANTLLRIVVLELWLESL